VVKFLIVYVTVYHKLHLVYFDFITC